MKKWLFLVTVGLFLLSQKESCYADEFANLPKLTVKGEASIFKPSDQMEVSLGVVTTADESAAAIEANNEHIRQIIANLQSLGLDKTDYQTGSFKVRPIYQKTAKNGDETEQGKISHYEALNSIQIKTQKISLSSQIIKAAVQGGANQINQLDFNLKNPQTYLGEAIKIAAQYALSDANAAAAATDVKLKRILNLSVDHWNNTANTHLYKTKGAAFSSEMPAGEIMEPGQTEIHAIVNITLEIGS